LTDREKCSFVSRDYCWELCNKLSQLLEEPESGDVIFAVQMENEEEKKNLYAFRSVLTANSEYFKASNSFRVITYLKNSVPAGNRRKK
jgi:hypothetical protein